MPRTPPESSELLLHLKGPKVFAKEIDQLIQTLVDYVGPSFFRLESTEVFVELS
jgi:hypothetical protein